MRVFLTDTTLWHYTEFRVLVQILNNFILVKMKTLGHRKKPGDQVVSSRTSRRLLFFARFQAEAEL